MTIRNSSLAAANETSSLRVRRPRFRPAPDVGAWTCSRPYHPRARIQSFQAFAAPFPGDQRRRRHMRAARVVRRLGHPARGDGNCSRRRSRRSQYEISGQPGHTVSARGSNLFKPLRREGLRRNWTLGLPAGLRRLQKGQQFLDRIAKLFTFVSRRRNRRRFHCETLFDRCLERERSGPPRDGKSPIWLLMRRSVILP